MKMTRKILITSLILFSLSAVTVITAVKEQVGIFSIPSQSSSQQQLTIQRGIPALTALEIENATIAKEYGINGYVKVTSLERNKIISCHPNDTIILHLYFKYTSYNTNVPYAIVTFNPKGDNTVMEQSLGDGKGVIRINDYVSYNITGNHNLMPNKIIPVTMTLHIPSVFPSTQLHLACVGVNANIDFIDDIGVTLNVQ